MHPYPAEKSRIGCLVMTRKLALNLGTKDSNPSAEEYGRLEMLYTLMPVCCISTPLPRTMPPGHDAMKRSPALSQAKSQTQHMILPRTPPSRSDATKKYAACQTSIDTHPNSAPEGRPEEGDKIITTLYTATRESSRHLCRQSESIRYHSWAPRR